MERDADRTPANNPDEGDSASRSVGDGPEIKGGVVFEVETSNADAEQARFFGNPDDVPVFDDEVSADPAAKGLPTDDGTLAGTSDDHEFGKGADADHFVSEKAASELERGAGVGGVSDAPESVRETYPQSLDGVPGEGGEGHIFIDTGEGGINQVVGNDLEETNAGGNDEFTRSTDDDGDTGVIDSEFDTEHISFE